MAQKPIAAHKFQLPIADEEALRTFVRVAWGVRIPDKQVCPNHTTPWRAFAGAYFARSSVAVWKASRGLAGKTYLLSLLALTEAVTLKANISILGGSGEQSVNALKYNDEFWQHRGAPEHLLVSDPKRETRLKWGNSIRALMASQASARGPHPQRLRLDEIDVMDIKILDAAMGQPMSKEDVKFGERRRKILQQTVMSSTHQNANGTMTKILQRAGEKGWPVHEWCFRESAKPHGWLAQSDIDQKKADVTTIMWLTEYELQEPSPESRAIQPDAVGFMFDKALGDYEGHEGEYIEIEPPLWVCKRCGYEGENHKRRDSCSTCRRELAKASYVHGTDWAKKVDWTVICTLRTDCDPMRIVAFERLGRRAWPYMVGRLNKRIERYGGRAAHDGTGIGDVVDGYLEQPATGIIMVGRARSDLITEYIAAIERKEIVSPWISFMESEHRYASVDDISGSGHLPDTIAAGALAYGEIGGVLFG
jgi:hypothetical protein